MAMLTNQPPAMFIWSGCWGNGGPRRRRSGTPYATRDYFQIKTTTGGRCWLFWLSGDERVETGPMKSIPNARSCDRPVTRSNRG